MVRTGSHGICDRARFMVVGVGILVSMLLLGCGEGNDPIVVGSKGFTEQVILGELLASVIETETDLPVERRLNLVSGFLCHQAVVSGEIDLYVEYTGTAFTGILEHAPITDPAEVLATVRREYADQFDLEITEPLGFNNTFAIMVRGEDARRLNLKTISDAAVHTPQWKAGFGYEFLERADGLTGLAEKYDLRFSAPPAQMDLGLMYRALANKEVDIVAGNSTEGLVEALDLAILEDDRHYFPPYEAVPVVNRSSLEKHPGLRQVLRRLENLISEEEMRQLNLAVDSEKRDVSRVVSEFLERKGLSRKK